MEDRGSHRAVAIAPSGDYVVVWSSQNQDLSGWGVYAQRFDKHGNLVGGEIPVTQMTTGDQQWATVAMDNNGNFVVAWTSFGQDQVGTQGVYARRFAANGAALDNEFLVNTITAGDQKNPSIAMDGDGDFIIVWEGKGPTDDDGIFARRFFADGSDRDGTEFRVNADLIRSHSEAAVSMNDSGEFVVSWDNSQGFVARVFSEAALAQTSEIVVRADVNAGNGSVATRNDGTFVATWREGFPGAREVRAQRFDSLGGMIGSQIAVNSTTNFSQSEPSIAADADGNFIVTWQGFGLEPGQIDWNGVFAQKFDSSGSRIDGEFLINQTLPTDQTDVSIAMLDINNFVAAWTDNDGSDRDVFVRQFGEGATAGGITGTVYEDVDGDGDVFDDNVFAAGVTVALYRDDGIISGEIDADDTLMSWTTTDVNGDYGFATLADHTYWIVVDSKSIAPSDGFNASHGQGDVWAEQTYGSAGSVTFGGAYSYSSVSGSLLGGMRGERSDNATALTSSEHVTRVIVAGSDVSNVDSGFSFNVITRTGDGDDDGVANRTVQGSFRQFISNSNAISGTNVSQFAIPNADSKFNISGNGGFLIQPTSELPAIYDQIVIDGYSQAGASRNTQAGDGDAVLKIQLDGALAGNVDGLILKPGSDGSTIKGLAITGYDATGPAGDAVTIESDGNLILGNFIGLHVDGITTTAAANRTGIDIKDGASGNTIGSADPGDRNVISNNDYAAIAVHDGGANNNSIIGNYLGVAEDSSTVIGNGTFGVVMWSITNGNAIDSNVIAGARDGVVIDGPGAQAAIRRNSIFGNSEQGIDLDNNGPTTNDGGISNDMDGGGNDRMNFPVINSVITDGIGQVTIDGELDGLPSTDFDIEFFYTVGESDEGRYYLGSISRSTGPSGTHTFAGIQFTGVVVPDGAFITATATARSGADAGSTSEFSVAEVALLPNVAPTLTNFAGPVATTDEETEVEITFAVLAVQGDENDPDGTVAAFVVTAINSGTLKIGTDAGSATAWVQNVNDTIDATQSAYWTPDLDVVGTVSAFDVVVRDDRNATSSTDVPVQVVVTPINDSDPVAGDDSITVAEGGIATTLDGGFASVLNNDTDADLPDDTLSVNTTPVSGPNFGTLLLNSDGTFQYTHDGSENFSDSFVYELLDANGGATDTATVSIVITPVNDEQVLTANTGATVNEGTTGNTITSLMLRTSDNDDSIFQLVYTITSATGNGTLRLSGTAHGCK